MIINLKNLEAAIISNNLILDWGDGLFVTNEEERLARITKLGNEARANFIRIMESPKNNHSSSYEIWAINKALNLSTKVQRNTRTKKIR